jgi:hypothetical protein
MPEEGGVVSEETKKVIVVGSPEPDLRVLREYSDKAVPCPACEAKIPKRPSWGLGSVMGMAMVAAAGGWMDSEPRMWGTRSYGGGASRGKKAKRKAQRAARKMSRRR